MNHEKISPTNTNAEPQFLKKREVARMFGVTERIVEAYMRRGVLPFYRLGRTVRFHRDDIREHLVANFKIVRKTQARSVIQGRKFHGNGFRSSH